MLAVTGAQRLGLKPVARLARRDAPADGWQRLSAGDGAKGPRFYDWAWLPYRSLRHRPRLAEGPADPPQDRQTRRADLPPDARPRGGGPVRSGTGSGHALDRRGLLRGGRGRGRPGPLRRGALVDRLAPPHVTLALLAHASLTVIKATVGGRGGARPRGRPAAPHRAGGAPARLAPGLGAPARPRAGAGVVALATTASAARPPLPLATPDAPPRTPAVVPVVWLRSIIGTR